MLGDRYLASRNGRWLGFWSGEWPWTWRFAVLRGEAPEPLTPEIRLHYAPIEDES